jgi:flagellar biosynthesis/type III secretory pathway M-ring protein FliF/YscJ
MDSWSQFPDRVRAWWNELSPRNRGYTVGTAVLILVAIALTMSSQSQPALVPLSLGKQLTSDELQRVETSLREHNLHDFRRAGDQILVPEQRRTDYDSVLVESRSLPGDWASDWERKFEATNVFTSSRKLRMLKEIALAKELKRIIQGLDGVQEASVVWTESDQQGWSGRKTGVTATVNIRSEPDRVLSERTIRGIQFSVANMVADLAPESVLVFDAATGRHYRMQPDEARFESDFDNWLELERRNWHARLESALKSRCPDAELLLAVDERGLRQRLRAPSRPRVAASTANGALRIRTDAANSAELLEFSQVRPRLQEEFSRQLSLTVRIPESWASRQRELTDALQSAAFLDSDSLSVRFEVISLPQGLERWSAPGTDFLLRQTGVGIVLSLILAAAAIWGISRRARRAQHSVSLPEKESRETPDVADSAPVDLPFAPPVATPPQDGGTKSFARETPLGDPETVASVLLNWLNSADPAVSSELAEDQTRG